MQCIIMEKHLSLISDVKTILSLCMQRCFGPYNFPENLYLTSGLWILLHDDISLQNETAYDKKTVLQYYIQFNNVQQQI